MPLREAWPPQLPPLRDFLISPGFGGCLVLLAVGVLLLASYRRDARRLDRQLAQQEQHHQDIRKDHLRREAIDRSWARLVWLVETASVEDAPDANAANLSLGLGPELTLAILEGLRNETKALADDTLAQAVAAYLAQYGLVLGQRIVSLPDADFQSNGHAEDTVRENGQSPNRHEAPVSSTTAEKSALAEERP
jgi:hypothetical protein